MNGVTPRHNPFRSGRVTRLGYRFLAGSMETLLDRCEHSGCRGAIVGPEGSGKTTLLEHLASELASRGRKARLIYLGHLSCAERAELLARLSRSRALPDREPEVLLLDGIELMLGYCSRTGFRWLPGLRSKALGLRSMAPLIVTAHTEKSLGASGLPVLHYCRTTPDLLESIVRELDPELPETLKKESLTYFHQQEGNVREVLRLLYDHYACRTALAEGATPGSESRPGIAK